MKQQIVSRQDSTKIIFECEVLSGVSGSLAMRHALEEEVAQRPSLDLSGAYLRHADLSGAYLRGAHLSGADLSGADLNGADLSGADLNGADLSGAYLNGADLSGADLNGADLRGAHLSGVYLNGADGKLLPRATPEQAIKNLDQVREIILDDESRLNMGHWHENDEWSNRTCAEETLCGTTHCIAGWLQVCTTEQALKTVDAQLAGVLAAPVASKMFFKQNAEALEWLRDREYVAETAAIEKRIAELKAKREAAKDAS